MHHIYLISQDCKQLYGDYLANAVVAAEDIPKAIEGLLDCCGNGYLTGDASPVCIFRDQLHAIEIGTIQLSLLPERLVDRQANIAVLSVQIGHDYDQPQTLGDEQEYCDEDEEDDG